MIRDLVDETRTWIPDNHLREHGQLRREVDKLTRANDAAPPPFWWGDVPEGDRPQRERDVREWVATILAEFPVGRRLVDSGCWWEHPAVRHHVIALWTAWLGAYRDAGRRYTDPDDWVAKRLPAFEKAEAVRNLPERREDCELHRPPRPSGL